ncbi:hypothetical protein MKEN_00472400 [Mycena kentingensis (nom. inval.)]|nr:hypothetical protein MKEN_00472400 [Mycena kentingensis (nom. inval.)]
MDTPEKAWGYYYSTSPSTHAFPAAAPRPDTDSHFYHPHPMSPVTVRRNVTHPALHVIPEIRNATDALVVLEAVRTNILPLITVRLSGSERDELRSGNVFVWEESPAHLDAGAGPLDGRKAVIELTEEERQAKAVRRAQRIIHPGTSVPPPRRNERPSKSGGLTKQTYTFQVSTASGSRRWHLVAYTLWDERTQLPVVESYPMLRGVIIPAGVFTRSGTSTAEGGSVSPVTRPGVLRSPTMHANVASGSTRTCMNTGGAAVPLPPLAALQESSSSSWWPRGVGAASSPDHQVELQLPPIRTRPAESPRWCVAQTLGPRLGVEPRPPDVVSQEGRRVLAQLGIRF